MNREPVASGWRNHLNNKSHSVVCSNFTQSLIRIKAKQVARRADFSVSDQDDIEQELALHLLTHIEKFDPERASLNTFITRVVDCGVSMLLRKRQSKKRMPGDEASVVSLEVPIDQPCGPPVSQGDVITSVDLDRRTLGRSRNEKEDFDTESSLGTAIESLPTELQLICQTLKLQSRSHAARTLGISRRQLSKQIELIREHMELAGFEKFGISAQPASETHK